MLKSALGLENKPGMLLELESMSMDYGYGA